MIDAEGLTRLARMVAESPVPARLHAGDAVAEQLSRLTPAGPPAPAWQSGAIGHPPGAVLVVRDPDLEPDQWRITDQHGVEIAAGRGPVTP